MLYSAAKSRLQHGKKAGSQQKCQKDGWYFPYVLPLTGKIHGPFRCSLAGLAISFPPLTQSPPILTKSIKSFLCSIMPSRPQRACDLEPHAKAMSHHVDHLPHGLGREGGFSSRPPSLPEKSRRSLALTTCFLLPSSGFWPWHWQLHFLGFLAYPSSRLVQFWKGKHLK